MLRAIDAAHSVHMGALGPNERGAAIQSRLNVLGYSDREFEKRTGIGRKTLRAAIDDGSQTRDSTWRSIERALDELERRVAGEPAAALSASDDRVVTFRLSGNFGINVALSGPVENLAELEASVERLMKRMGDSPDA